MKFSLYKELLDQNDTLGHLFLHCIPDGLAEKIAKENESMSKEDIDKRKIDIELKINGTEVDPRKFFDMFSEQYARIVTEEATNLLKEKTSGKVAELYDQLNIIEQSLGSIADDLDWDWDPKKNPFKKHV